MTNAIERVSPVIHDGIEFYCSMNGEETGMSQTGLAKFVGLPATSLQRLLESFGLATQTESDLDVLASFQLGIYCENLVGMNQRAPTRIIKADFCGELCAYVAYEYKGGNKIARYSLKRFASSGIQNFIQKVTGHQKIEGQSENLTLIVSMLRDLTKDVGEMRVELGKTAGYRTAKVFYPGLSFIPEDSLEDDTVLMIEGDLSWYTITEALVELFPNISFDKGAKVSIGKMVAATWKSLKQEYPTKIIRYSDKGTKKAPVAGYPASFLPLIKNDVNKFVICG